MILFMSILCIIICPEYFIIGCLVNTILDKEVGKLFPMKDNMNFYKVIIHALKIIALWPVVILFYTQQKIRNHGIG